MQVNAHEDGCFKFLGDETNSTWFEAMVACEKVPFGGIFWRVLFPNQKLGGWLFSRAQDSETDGVPDRACRA